MKLQLPKLNFAFKRQLSTNNSAYNFPECINTKLCLIDALDRAGRNRTEQIRETASRIVNKISFSENIQDIIEIIEDFSRDGILTIDTKGNIESINKTVVSLFNYNIDELKNINIKDIVPLFTFESTHGLYVEMPALKRNTTEFFVELNATPIDGNTKFVLIIKDVTYNKQLISQNNSLGNLLESLMCNTPNPVYHKNGHLRYIGCNKSFERLTGYTSEVIFNSRVDDLFPEEIAKQAKIKDNELINNLDETNHQIYTCSIYNKFSNRTMEVMVYNTAILDHNKQFTGIVGTVIDLTDYINAKKSAKLFETVLNETTEPVFILGNNGEVTFANKSFLNLLGYNKTDFFKLTTNQYLEFTAVDTNIVLIDSKYRLINKKARIVKIPNDELENTLFMISIN